MSSKNNTEVIIGGKVFTLSGYESEEYLQKVASYINGKLAEFNADDAYRRQSRSEEHTSELQSPCNLVCRLLLEKNDSMYHERKGLVLCSYTI